MSVPPQNQNPFRATARPLHRRLRTLGWIYAILGVTASAAAVPSLLPAVLARVAVFGVVPICLGSALLWRLHAAALRWRARRSRPLEGDAEIARGLADLLAGERSGAEERFRELAARDPADVEAAFYLGLTLREQGDLAGSKKALRRALRIDLGRKWTGEILALLAPIR